VEAAVEILGPGRVTVLSKSDDPAALKLWGGSSLETHATGHVPSVSRTTAFGGMLIQRGLAEEPDLVVITHAHFSPAARILSQLKRIPAAVSAHGVEVWDLPPGMTRNGLLAADTILPVSDYTKNRLKAELQLPDDKFQVVPNTFDPVRFCPATGSGDLRGRYGLKATDQVILCVSRLEASEQYKGYRQILQVLPSLARRIPHLKFLLVGRGNDRANIEKLIDELKLRDLVILAGFVTALELPDHYRMADAFAMPSKREGFGIVYLEAMGCGKMCLGGNKDAAVDALRHGELGRLVDPDNLPELEDGLFRLLTGPKPSPQEIHDRASRYFGRPAFRAKVRTVLESFGLR
jgi:glycosyltransferase involved in cell wall biosynthesis